MKGQDDVVARLRLSHPFTHPLDDAGALVAEHSRQGHRSKLVARLQIGVAHPSPDHANQHLVCSGLFQF
jgi:hypothetical protein